MTKGTVVRGNQIEFGGYLTLDPNGGMKLTRGVPGLRPNERAMFISVTVPISIFKVPTLRAAISVPDNLAPPIISVETVGEIERVLAAGIGMDVTVTIGDVIDKAVEHLESGRKP